MDAEDNRKLPAQAQFLAAVSLLNPEVPQSLRKLSEASIPEPRGLRTWAGQWNLATDWVIEWANHTITWKRTGPSRLWKQFYHPQWSPRSRYDRKPETISEAMMKSGRVQDLGPPYGCNTFSRAASVARFSASCRSSVLRVVAAKSCSRAFLYSATTSLAS